MPLEPIDFYGSDRNQVDHARPLQPREELSIELLHRVLAGEGGGLLDVGCGSGLLLEALDGSADLTRRGWHLHGVDYSEYALECASRLPYDFRRCNLEEGIPLDDGSVDVVCAGEVIEHVYSPDRLLQECRRVLRPGGHLLLTTPNLQAWYNRALFALGVQPLFYESSTETTAIGAGPLRRFKRSEEPVGHIRLLNRRALLDLLDSGGFAPLAVRGSVFPALPGPVLAIDRVLSRRPSLASIFVVLARRV